MQSVHFGVSSAECRDKLMGAQTNAPENHVHIMLAPVEINLCSHQFGRETVRVCVSGSNMVYQTTAIRLQSPTGNENIETICRNVCALKIVTMRFTERYV